MSKNEVSSIKTNENVSGFGSIGFCEKVSGFVKKYRVILYRVFFFSQICIGLKYRVLYRVFPKKGQPDKKKTYVYMCTYSYSYKCRKSSCWFQTLDKLEVRKKKAKAPSRVEFFGNSLRKDK